MNELELKNAISELKRQFKSYNSDADYPYQTGILAGRIFELEMQLCRVQGISSFGIMPLEYGH